MATRILPPSSLRSVTWYTQFQEIVESISLPNNKRFGITKRLRGISPNTLLTKATNIRAQYEDINNNAIPYSNTWSTVRAAEAQAVKGIASKGFSRIVNNGEQVVEDINGLDVTTDNILAINNYMGLRLNGNYAYTNLNISTSIPTNGTIRFNIINNSGSPIDLTNGYSLFSYYFKPANEIAQNIYSGTRKGTGVFAELNENGLPFSIIEQIYSQLYNLIKANDNTVNSPSDTELYGDYFEALNGYSTDVTFREESPAEVRAFLESEYAARGTSRYYTDGAINYRNRVVGGYFDGIRIMLDGASPYSQIASIERAFVAEANRKVAVFGWGSFEGVGGAIDGAMWQRLPLQNGDLLRLARAQGSYDMTEQQAFFTLFLANSYFMWNDNAFYSNDINCWDKAHIGGSDDWKTRYQPYGGQEQQWDVNNPSHPKPSTNCNNSSWSDSAAPNLNGGFSGVYIYSKIYNRCNTKIKYATFNYTDNGGIKNGYFNGNIPVLGSKNDGSVSTFGNSNYGQHNIANQWEHRKPLVFEGLGTEGNMIAILNLRCGLTESVTYNIATTNNGNQTIVHQGRSLGIYTI